MGHPTQAKALAEALRNFYQAQEEHEELKYLEEAENLLASAVSPDSLLGECFGVMQKEDPVEAIESLQFVLAEHEFGEDTKSGKQAALFAIPLVGSISQLQHFARYAERDQITSILKQHGRIPRGGEVRWFSPQLLRPEQVNDWLLEVRRKLLTAALEGGEVPTDACGSEEEIVGGIKVGARLLVGCMLASPAAMEEEAQNPALLGSLEEEILEDPDSPVSEHDQQMLMQRHESLEGEREALLAMATEMSLDSITFGPVETLGLALVEAAALHLQYLHGIEMQLHGVSEQKAKSIYEEGEVHVFGNLETSSLMAGVRYGQEFFGPYETLLPWKCVHTGDFLEKMAACGVLSGSEEVATLHDTAQDLLQALKPSGKVRLH